MPGQVDLGDDSDAQLRRIVDNFTDLVLSIVASVTDAVVRVEIPPYHGTAAVSADKGKLGITLDLDAPALVVGQMPVETVELVDGHDVKIALDCIHAEEMPCAVEMHASVGEPRPVGDHCARQAPVGTDSD